MGYIEDNLNHFVVVCSSKLESEEKKTHFSALVVLI